MSNEKAAVAPGKTAAGSCRPVVCPGLAGKLMGIQQGLQGDRIHLGALVALGGSKRAEIGRLV